MHVHQSESELALAKEIDWVWTVHEEQLETNIGCRAYFEGLPNCKVDSQINLRGMTRL